MRIYEKITEHGNFYNTNSVSFMISGQLKISSLIFLKTLPHRKK